MDFEEIYRESLTDHGCVRYLKIKKKATSLFDRTIIDLGRKAKEKWRRIIDKESYSCGVSDCAYCKQFHKPEKLNCKGCPVELFTKKARCLATPYYTYVDNPTISNAIAMKDFVDEIFIRSLLLIDWRKYYAMSGM